MRAKVEQELTTALDTATAERIASTKAAEDKLRKVLKSSEIRRKALEAEKEELVFKAHKVEVDYKDTFNAHEIKIDSLVNQNHQLKEEHWLIPGMLKHNFSDATFLGSIIDKNLAGMKEKDELRASVKQLSEHNENLLDKIQQMADQSTTHQHAELDARLEAGCIQNKMYDLEDKIALQKEQILDTAKQPEAFQGGHVRSVTHFAALDAIERQNDGLRDAFIAERLRKEELQKKSDAPLTQRRVAYLFSLSSQRQISSWPRTSS